METNKNHIKEDIKKIAQFALYYGHRPRTFKELEYQLEMSKKEIINILNIFVKAKFFSYKIFSIPFEDEYEDPFYSKKRFEARTGGLRLFAIPSPSKDKIKHKKLIEQKLKDLINSPANLNDFVKKYSKHLKLPIIKYDSKAKIGKLEINLTNGNFTYYNKKGSLNTRSQEYRMLHALIESTEHYLSYEQILQDIFPHLSIAKINRTYLYTLKKKIHHQFGVLPKDKKANPEFIKNTKNTGYKLVV